MWRLVLDGFLTTVRDLVRQPRVRPGQAGEVKLHYRVRRWNVRLGAESYFFEEGHAADYARAKYGELRVTSGGDDGSSYITFTLDTDKIEADQNRILGKAAPTGEGKDQAPLVQPPQTQE